jgi:hypothetical protein
MSHYIGGASLDAEISVDFVGGAVTIDYSLNSLGSPYSSNDSVCVSSEWRSAPLYERIWQVTIRLPLFIGIIPVAILMSAITFVSQYKLIRLGPTWQLRYQKFLTWYFINVGSQQVQSKSGELKDTILEFIMPNNIGMTYQLEGEYQENIQSISLKRRFLIMYRFGKYKEERQQGWKVVFQFSKPPVSGSCVVRSVM